MKKHYPGVKALDGVDLEGYAGEVLAVCGPTGSGKSSLLELVPRFYDPADGVVLLGGRDARTLRLADVHAATALVDIGRERGLHRDDLIRLIRELT